MLVTARIDDGEESDDWEVKDHRTIVPTPWESINELLQGGLGNGDFGLVK